MRVVDDFFMAFIEHFSPLTTVWREGLPPSLLRGAADQNGYVEWAMVRRRDAVDFSSIESIGLTLPSLFKSWLTAYEALEDYDVGLLRLVHSPAGAPLARLQDLLAAESDVADRGLIPIGYEATMDAGPVCIAPDGRIVLVDRSHEVEPPLFSSFEAMLACLTVALRNPDGDADDFARLDPQMPAEAKRYWARLL
ncbi:MAG: hypothetical protein KC731_22570 [Myxococcales bacterium]|nr:hypothetical protein [Myxococcales bacterium]